MNKSSNQIDMCEGALFPKFIKFAIPIMLSNLLQHLFSAADMMVIGIFGNDTSLAAITSTGSITALLTGLLLGISIGANVIAARHFGAKNDEMLSRSVHTSLVFSIIAGILITTLGLVFSPLLLVAMGVPESILPLSRLYLSIYFAGIIPTVIFTYAAAILRAVGDTKRPLYYLTIAGALNFVLNIIFVTLLKLDVAGVALATVISQIVAMILIIRCLLRETGAIRLDFKKLSLDKSILIQILKIGFPAGLQTSLFSLSNIAIQSSVNSFGEDVISGCGAASTLESFVYLAMNAWTVVVVSSTSQNFGQHNYKRIRKSQLLGQLCVIASGLLVGGTLAIFGRQFIGIYVDSAYAIDAGLLHLYYVCIPYFIFGITDVLTAGLRGLDCSFLPMLINLFTAIVLRIVWVNTIVKIPEYHNLHTLFVIYPASWIFAAVSLAVIFVIVLKRISKKFPSIITK